MTSAMVAAILIIMKSLCITVVLILGVASVLTHVYAALGLGGAILAYGLLLSASSG